jgi:hypothetical protein
MNKAEQIIASKRMSKWPRALRDDVLRLPPSELAVLGQLVALLDARPIDVVASDR